MPRARPALAVRLAFAYVAVFFFMGTYVPYWPVWLAHRGMSPSEVGILLGIAPWARVLASPLAGRWADRHGRADRLVLILSIACMLALSAFTLAHDFGDLLLIMIAVGLVHAPIIPLLDGLTITAEAEGRLRYGPVRLWGSASFIAASWVGGALLELQGEAVVLWILVGAAASTTLAAAHLPYTPPEGPGLRPTSPEPLPEGPGLRPASAPSTPEGPGLLPASPEPLPEGPGLGFSVRSWSFGGFLAVTALLHGSHAVLYAFGTEHWRAQGLDESTAGLLWAESVLAEIVLFAYGSRVGRWLTPRALWLAAGGAGVVRWAILSSTIAMPALVLVQALHALTYGALHLGAMTYIREHVPGPARSRATTLYSAISTGLALGIALPLAGELYARFGGHAYGAMSIMSLLAMALAVPLHTPRRAATSVGQSR